MWPAAAAWHGASSLSEDLQDELEAVEAIFGARLSIEYPTRLSVTPAINLALELPGADDTGTDPTTFLTTGSDDPPPPPPPPPGATGYLLRMVLPAGYPDAAVPTAKVCGFSAADLACVAVAVDKALQEFLAGLEAGEPLIFEIAEWVSDYVDSLPPETPGAAGSASTPEVAAAEGSAALDRQWICENHAMICDNDLRQPVDNQWTTKTALGSLPVVSHRGGRGMDMNYRVAYPLTHSCRFRGPCPRSAIEHHIADFIGFYTKSIRDGFCGAAGPLGCTGFLMPGKPAIAAVEGSAEAIAEFIRVSGREPCDLYVGACL